MSLLKRFDDDLRTALKASESAKVSILRMAKAALKNRQIEKGRELTDDEILSVISSMVKQGREAQEQFSAAGRVDLARKEEQEVAILQAYLPQQLGRNELDRIILDAIKEASATTPQDMGKVMRVLMPRIKGVADGKYVNQRVKELLESGSGVPSE
jgi:uncharacterized protein YqeY